MTELTHAFEASALSLRSPATVMDLERLGSFSPTRLSFARRLTRMMFEQQWRVSRTQFELDEKGHGSRSIACRHPLTATMWWFSLGIWKMLSAPIG